MTARDQLLALGVPARRVSLAIPYLFFAPMSVDHRAAGVREIVGAIQHRLREVGFLVRPTGVIDVATTRALDRLVPPAGSFAARSFSELAALVLSASTGHASSRSALSGTGWDHGLDRSNCVGLGATKATFVGLQRGINRLASKLGTPRVTADGIIGKTTVSAAKAVASKIYNPPSSLWSNARCETLANNAAKIAASFHQKADALGAPKNPTKPRPKAPVGIEASTAATPANANAIVRFAPYLLLAGGVAFLAVKMRGELM